MRHLINADLSSQIMSFKGTDETFLKNLSHERVRELLSSHIPQDEAKLLSNGRLTCTICVHRPIFDTINMLSLHRKGKRHLRELSKFIECKEDAAIKALRNCPPPKNENKMSSVKNMSKNVPLKHMRKPILEVPKSKISSQVPSMRSAHNDGKSPSATVRSYLKSMSRKHSLPKVVEKNREHYGVDLCKTKQCHKDSWKVEECHQGAATSSTATQKFKSIGQDAQSQNYEINLRMSGWIKDLTGAWIKDPNVEFDSDEDDVPPPVT